ncbi:MAG TPA: hypothetical protein VK716_04945 [Terracidiphilus sp.]|nr:hypothetical protein [Terracidiphilus sp.]
MWVSVSGAVRYAAAQQEPPYFVTYSSVLEEPGNLEIEDQNIAAAPKNTNGFFAPTVEFEYGVTAWWTAEAYLQGQATDHDSAVFTGFRFENRFRPLPREYWINPVLYVEYEDVSAADKSFLEITGNTSITTQQVPNAALRKEVERSIEGKLILSSNGKGWNISENIISEKAMNEAEAWEFGYAVAAARPFSLKGSSRVCIFCRQNFAAGVELFGGLGTRYTFGLKQTQQYAGPTIAMNTPKGITFKFSPEFGLNDNSAAVLWRFGASFEIQQFRDLFWRTK